MNTEKIHEEYHKWYYNTEVWKTTTFMGVQCLKSVSDLWNYQEILFSLQPSLVVEYGTFNGGSALFFATMLQPLNFRFKVVTIDVDHENVAPMVREKEHIEMITSSTIDPKVRDRILILSRNYPGSIFVIIDSDHHKDHVMQEMESLRGVLKKGDYLIVEDGNINGHPVLPGWGEGPMEAILEYFQKYPNDYEWDTVREKKFGFTFAPKGFLIHK